MKWAVAIAIAVSTGALQGQSTPGRFDTIIRHGTVIDGSGNPRFDADVGIRRGYIAAIGNLSAASAATEIDARGLFVAPGFINIHSHASPDALPTAVNMLTQGVTTEIFNADGGGPLDVAQQMAKLSSAGLAVNVGGYIGFNAVWQAVNGNSDRRPGSDDVSRMREMIAAGLTQGAWGVSAGLDYKPGYFAQTEEVIRIVDVARPARTNFTNHDRITPESNYSSKAGVAETIAIGERAGLVPVVTHMKSQGREQGRAGELLSSMTAATRRGHYTAADAYPYLAGQSGLGALMIPAWAQEGGRDAMLKRFADPTERVRIIKETEEAMNARFGGPQGVYLPRTQQELTDVMKEMDAGAGETVLRVLENGDPGAILRFGNDDDLIRILQNPSTSMACDCGASTATRVHPRFYGSYPRVLGRYVRELKALTWEDAIRKSSSLPAATIGMVDRGLVAVGMAADVVVFDPATIVDRATYASPAVASEGVRHVLVNGALALKDGAPTGAQSGRPLIRTNNMPSRPASSGMRRVRVRNATTGGRVELDLRQRAGAREAVGTFTLDDPETGTSLKILQLGVLQMADNWASFTGRSTVGSGLQGPKIAADSAITVIIDVNDPAAADSAVIVVSAEGTQILRRTLQKRTVTLND